MCLLYFQQFRPLFFAVVRFRRSHPMSPKGLGAAKERRRRKTSRRIRNSPPTNFTGVEPKNKEPESMTQAPVKSNICQRINPAYVTVLQKYSIISC